MRLHPDPIPLEPSGLRLSVTRDDMAASRYYYVPVDVPAGTRRLDVAMDYARAPDCLIDIGLFDRLVPYPARGGFRGWSGGARAAVFVARDAATPGYVAGPIPLGRWHVILGLVRLPEGETQVHLTATVDTPPTTPEPDTARWRRDPSAAAAPQGEVDDPGPSVWLKGDCHSHTCHSDAKGAPATLQAQAERAGLDFLFVTDHNTDTAHAAHFDAASGPDLLFLRGIEITTPFGHANALGIETWVDFRMEADADPHALLAEVHAAGGLLSINHDKPGSDEWRWPLPAHDAMEVFHRHWLLGNGPARARYDARLAARRRIALIGGSDWHQPAQVSDDPFGLGTPTTVLHAETRSPSGILAAIKAGRGYVTEAPDGPGLIVEVDGAPMGSVLAQGRHLRATTTGAEGDDLVLIADAQEVARRTIPADGIVEIPLPKNLAYVRAEIEATATRDAHIAAFRDWQARFRLPRGKIAQTIPPILRAMANPHYFGAWT